MAGNPGCAKSNSLLHPLNSLFSLDIDGPLYLHLKNVPLNTKYIRWPSVLAHCCPRPRCIVGAAEAASLTNRTTEISSSGVVLPVIMMVRLKKCFAHSAHSGDLVTWGETKMAGNSGRAK